MVLTRLEMSSGLALALEEAPGAGEPGASGRGQEGL